MSYNLVDPITGDLTKVAGNSNIVDSAIETDSTWSSKKISDELGELEKNVKFDVDDLNTAYVPNKTITVRTNKNTKNLPPSSIVNFLVTSFAYVEVQYYRITQYCYENSENLSSAMHVRRGISNNGESSITWSAWKELVTMDKLDDKQDFRIFKSLEEFNEKKGTSLTVVSGVDNMKDIANAMSNGEILIIITKYELGSDVYFGLTTDTGWTKMFTFVKSNGLCDVECRTTYPLTLKRVLNSDGVVGDWQQLATTDSTLKTIQLSGTVDCNTLTEPGLYTASSGAVISITNTPANIGSAVQLDGGFSVLVTKTNVDSVYYGMQMFIPYGSDLPFIRKSYYLNGQYWTPWQELATMDKVNALHKETTGYITGSLLGSVVKDANLYYQKFGDSRLVINGWVSIDAVSAKTPIFTLPSNWKASSNYLLPCYVDNSNVACACKIDLTEGTVYAYTPLPATIELRFCGEIYLI